MFIGHLGLAFALKRAEPRLSLPALFLAVQWVDVLWALFLLLGWEHVDIVPGYTAASPLDFTDYPLTHSLAAALLWALAVGAFYYSWPTKDTSRHRQRTAVVMAAVASHYLLDLVAHVPDLPLLGNDSSKLGLGLWRSLPATVAVETSLLLGGVLIYLWHPSRKHAPSWIRVLLLAAILLALFLGSLAGPPPPSVRAMALTLLASVPILLLLAGWAGKEVARGKERDRAE
ncbi:MAG: hypothetical protein ACREMO_09770 [Gemmatimonadales bacterium]